MDLQLKDHISLIVGGCHGIGLATARAFAAEGSHVVLWDHSPEVISTGDNLGKPFGVKSLGFQVDIVDETSLRDAHTRTVKALGPIDHLVHTAAIGSGKFGFPFTNLTPADWPRILQVNVLGMANVAHTLAPHMIERKAGTMVYLASVAGQIGSQTDPPYSASKAANINFAQCLAKDLAPHGIRVNTVCPGMVQTGLNRSVWQAWHDQTPPALRLSYEEWAGQKIRTVVPLGRWQAPENIADMIVFLSSIRAEQVTGQSINVDGGFVMHW